MVNVATPPLSVPLALPAGTTTTLSRAFNDVQASGTIAPTSIDKNFDNSYVQSWNLNVQREITPSLGLTIAYVGSKGTHLRIQRNINQIRPDGTRGFLEPAQK